MTVAAIEESLSIVFQSVGGLNGLCFSGVLCMVREYGLPISRADYNSIEIATYRKKVKNPSDS